MKFEQFVNLLQNRIYSNRKWLTILNENEFQIQSFDDDGCFYIISDLGRIKKIKIEEIRQIWGLSKRIDIKKRFSTASYSKSVKSGNLSYILSIIENVILH